MPNLLTTTFMIEGVLANSYMTSTKAASAQINKMSAAIDSLKAEQRVLDNAYNTGVISMNSYNRAVAGLKSRIDATQNSYNNLRSSLATKVQIGANFREAKMNLVAAFGTLRVISAPLVSATKTAMDFEAAMSKVGAITKADAGEMQQLSATAKDLGKQTMFSATQSAEAMSYLGMAGWKTNEIIAGMPGLLNLAAAGGTDLARTADIVSDNLTAFGLAAEQSGHMADVYATIITQTNTNVEMLGETMKFAAPVAHAFGASMEETAAIAGLMANNGIKASNAGTALRAGLLRLAGPPKMASAAMQELGMSMNDITAEQKEAAMAMASYGIQMSDDSGPKKMSVILQELRERTKDLGQEEQLSAMKAIFGQNAAAGWLAVLQSGDDVFDKLVADLEKSDGAAEKMAQRMQDNAKGSITKFTSAAESLAISLGEALLPALTDVANTMAWMASGLADFTSKHETLTKAIVYLSTAVAGLWLAFKAGKALSTGLDAFIFNTHELGKAISKVSLETVVLNTKMMILSTTQKIAAAATTVFNTAMSVGTKVVGGMQAAVLKLFAVLMANPWIAWLLWQLAQHCLFIRTGIPLSNGL